MISLADILYEAESRKARKKGQKKKSSKHSDLFTDEDPKGTIHGLGFKNATTARKGIAKVNKAKRTHAHKVQATLVMKQRAKVAKERAKDPEKKSDLNQAYQIWSAHLEKLKAKTKKMNEGSSNSTYTADAGEPDTGFIPGGKTRRLGMRKGKPEPWFEGGGYTQVDFPKGDYIYGKRTRPEYSVKKRNVRMVVKLKQSDKPLNERFIVESSKMEILDVVSKVYPHIVKDLGGRAVKVEVHNNIYRRLGAVGEEDLMVDNNPYGEYDWDKRKIYLYASAISNTEQIIRSLLHEHTHTLQNRKKFKAGYDSGKYDYKTHPYEKAATRAEMKWKNYLKYL
tara:strand:+ start:3847 stop:4860 length:1014 start_codon:yes stop_codon:yes gene_type:complete